MSIGQAWLFSAHTSGKKLARELADPEAGIKSLLLHALPKVVGWATEIRR